MICPVIALKTLVPTIVALSCPAGNILLVVAPSFKIYTSWVPKSVPFQSPASSEPTRVIGSVKLTLISITAVVIGVVMCYFSNYTKIKKEK